ncbi:MAG: PQQ-dependent sugar dehydrogenase [Steroidobacteraceae bacterium]
MKNLRTPYFALVLGLLVCAATNAAGVRATTVVDGVNMGWSFAFLPDGSLLVTERPGQLRHATLNGKLGAPLTGVPKVVYQGQGGLLDVLVDSNFARDRTIFFCYSEAGAGGNSTALARATVAQDVRSLDNVRVIFRQAPKVESRAHFGCRIVEAPDGNLFLTLGERFSRMQDAQTLDNHHGKLVRIDKDGGVPADNPFAQRGGALPEIWSFGHRNLQGATLDDKGRLWTTEHGPQGGDELNHPEAGKNYGWPVITYGENYGGGKIGGGITEKAGMEQPVKYWVPSIAPSGLAYLTSDKYGKDWRGSFFVGSLKFRFVTRVPVAMAATAATAGTEERVIELGQRVRDIRQGPDGLLYVLTEDARGRIVRLDPQ